MIREAFRKIYSGENAIIKHIILFALTGIPLMLTTPLNEISKREVVETPTAVFALLALLVCAVVGIYLGGYFYGVLHNSFDEIKSEILPDFDKSWFRIFFKGFPLQLTWIAYFIALFVITIVGAVLLSPYLGKNFAAGLSLFVITIVTVLIMIGLPLVFAVFSKDYDRTGLYKFTLPFELFGKSIKSVLFLILKLLPIGIVVLIVNSMGNGTDVMAYLFAAVGGYLTTILQYVGGYGYVQICKKNNAD